MTKVYFFLNIHNVFWCTIVYTYFTNHARRVQQITTPVTTVNSLYIPMLFFTGFVFLLDCVSTVDVLFLNSIFVVDWEHSIPDFVSKKLSKCYAIYGLIMLTIAIIKVWFVKPTVGTCIKWYKGGSRNFKTGWGVVVPAR